MSVATADLLSAAQRIFNTGSCEADWRNTSSRAYYAVFHDIKAFADALAADAHAGHIPAGTKRGTHHQLYTGLQNPTVPRSDPRHKRSFTLGLMAQNLHSARVKADYNLGGSVDQAEARNNLTTAQNILAVIAGQPVGTPLPKFGGTSSSNSIIAPSSSPTAQPFVPAQPPSSAVSPQSKPSQGVLKIIK